MASEYLPDLKAAFPQGSRAPLSWFTTTFEDVTEISGWNDREKARYLRAKLAGEASQIVRGELQKSTTRQKRQYNRAAEKPGYKVEDPVWLNCPKKKIGLSSMLQRPWKGPNIMTKKLSDAVYRTKMGPRVKAMIVHADRLKARGLKDFSWAEQFLELILLPHHSHREELEYQLEAFYMTLSTSKRKSFKWTTEEPKRISCLPPRNTAFPIKRKK
ncbi:hypothetical protein HOLleu_21861 [Holothuria leucospilota]|uniref:Integrase p58-like C-terminal domain-containing protein n=1 Tax=Holothuria leucospilota TaxID=206669 RepID=A0A9Q1BYK1_HOLLE|nr:hypothetical protein HOLleu_21861 [Holothuria leucospilota]